jgi:hypothetical protein
MPKRIQRRRSKGWKMPEGAVSVGRPTLFGNPFSVQKYLDVYSGKAEWLIVHEPTAAVYRFSKKPEAIAAAVELFRANALADSNESWRRKVVFALRGKDLACWCPLDQPCHADVLLEIANGRE